MKINWKRLSERFATPLPLRLGRVFLLLFFIVFGALAPSASAQTLVAGVIQKLQYDTRAQMLGFISSARTIPQVQYLPSAAGRKVVIDLPDTIFPQVRDELEQHIPGVEKVRISQFTSNPPAVRMVLDVESEVDVAIRTEALSSGFQTWIQPRMHGDSGPHKVFKVDPPSVQLAAISAAELRQIEVRNNNLYLSGSGALYPEIRKLDAQEKRYGVTLYNVRSTITGKRPELTSSLFRDVQIVNSSDRVEIQFKLSRDDVEIVPFSEDNSCTIQFLVLASSKNLAQLDEIEIMEMDQQVTRIRVHTNRPFDYQLYALEKPHRLVMDTIGTVLTQREDLRKIQSSSNLQQIRMAAVNTQQNTDIRIVFDLKGDVNFQYSSHERYVEIIVQAREKDRPPLLDEASRRAFIVIDAGHGGNDPGAIGKGGVREKAVTLAVSEYLKRYLENDQFKVILTRAEDLEILLQPRVDVANLRNSDLFISIHCNSMPPNNEHIKGIETYYTTPQSKELADVLHQYLVKELKAPDRRVRKRGLFVTRKTKMPSVLLEIGFVSNPEEEALLGNSSYQRLVAKAIRNGIYDYLGKHKPQRGGNL
jgi:N-acetylmuramoyl-L-alanine amidase